MNAGSGEITALLTRVHDGEQVVVDQLIPLVYKSLRRIAGQYMRLERPDHTLQPTALVHEAFVRLIDQPAESRALSCHRRPTDAPPISGPRPAPAVSQTGRRTTGFVTRSVTCVHR